MIARTRPLESTPGDRRRRSPVLRSAASYFGIVFGAGFLLGSVRVALLAPRIGERAAELAEMPLMFVVIFVAAGYLVRRYGACVSPTGWILVGVTALGLLLGAEVMLAVVLAGRDVAEYIAGRDPVSGSAYIGMLVVFAAMPSIRSRLA